MVVKLRKGQIENFGNIANFDNILLKIKKLISSNSLTITLSYETIQYPCFKPEEFHWLIKIHTLEHDKNFPKMGKKLKFYPKITKTGVKKILITITLTLETMQQLIFKHWRRYQGP